MRELIHRLYTAHTQISAIIIDTHMGRVYIENQSL
jgi:hypothetical protein